MSRWLAALLTCLAALGLARAAGAEPVKVGSKAFTESVILGEITGGLVRSAGADVDHRAQLGGTRVLWQALLSGELDVYPEYTGTIVQEILGGREVTSLEEALLAEGVLMTAPLGFDNTYALGMTKKRAAELGASVISDLAKHPGVALGFSTEFMERGDGWPALRDRYGLGRAAARGLDHDLAYRGLLAGDIDVVDLYATDAEIRFYDLQVLRDDLRHFPSYQALLLYRRDLGDRHPGVVAALRRLEGAIDAPRMTAMNAAVKLDGRPEAAVAAEFLATELRLNVEVKTESLASRLLRATKEHLALVLIAIVLSILIAVPIGVVAAKLPRLGRGLLGIVGILQTIPSLALLVVLIPVLGLGERTAIAALVIYGLLPIVRSTHTGLTTIPKPLVESALALGLTPWARLRRVELPLALPAVLSGMQTSAVVAVGTATLGALIGAGGYGQAILTGVRLARTSLILEGAIPAAALALVIQGVFEVIERVAVPPGIRA